jgi:hypothetical protein
MFEATEIINENNDWITFVFLIILLILTIAKVFFNDRLLHLSTLFISKKYFLMYFHKEKNNVLSVFQTLLFIVQVLVVSMFLYYANIYLQQKNDFLGLNNYMLIVAGVCIYLGLRFLAGLFLAYILDFKNGHKKLVFEKMNYLNSLILWMIPFLILCVYATKFKFLLFVSTFSLFVMLIVIRYVLFLSNNKKLVFNDFFYFILYLCTLEIAPLIIFFKLTI